ncbi:pyridoxal-phosphate dependent enzyme [Streptomyces sp. NPDC004561]
MWTTDLSYTPARIYFKNEGVSPAGSHKPNTAIPQAHYNKQAGVARLTTETGAGQWGSSLSLACRYFGLVCEVYMVKVSYQQKPYRRGLMETYGATITASPSELTQAGRDALAADPDSPGSLGLAVSEAVEAAVTSGGTAKYALGSVLNHVLMHQTIIGQEAQLQMEPAEDHPDITGAPRRRTSTARCRTRSATASAGPSSRTRGGTGRRRTAREAQLRPRASRTAVASRATPSVMRAVGSAA